MATETPFAPVQAPYDPIPAADGTTTSQRLGLGPMLDKLEKGAQAKAAAAPVPPPKHDVPPAEQQPAAEEIETPPETTLTPETPKPETPPPEAKPPEDVGEATEEDLKVAKAMVDNPHLTNKQRRPWQKFLKEKEAREAEQKTWQEERTTLQKERDEARQQAEARKDYDELKAKRAEIEAERDRFRAVVEAENDPVFQQKYTERAQRHVASIESALRTIGVKDKAFKFVDDGDGVEKEGLSLEFIASHGGILAFARANPGVYRALLERMEERDPVAANSLRINLSNLAEVENDRMRELGEIKNTPQKLSEARAKVQQQTQQQQEQRRQTIESQLAKVRATEYERHDAFKLLPIPDKASADEKARIEATNKERTRYRESLAKVHQAAFMGTANANDLAEASLRAVLYEFEHAQRTTLEQRVKELTEENTKLKRAGLVKPAGTTTPAPASARQVTQPVKEPKDSRELISSTFDLAEKIARDRQGAASGNLSN